MDNHGGNPFLQPFYHCDCGWQGRNLNWSNLHAPGGMFFGRCPKCGRRFEGVYRTDKELRAEQSGGK